MILKFGCIAAIGVMLGLNGQTSQVAVRVGPVPGMNVTTSPDGNYTIEYEVNGQKRNFVFVPATKVVPAVETSVFRAADGAFVYGYSLSNGRKARQELHSIALRIPFHGQTTFEAPPGWETVETAATQRLTWYKIPASPSAGLDGIPPGHQVTGFQIRSMLLPGPTELWCKGAVISSGLRTDIPPMVLARLEQTLVLRNQVLAWALAPAVSIGEKEPELTAGVFVSRIRNAYAGALEVSRHPAKSEILAALSDAIEQLSTDRRHSASALRRAKALAEDGGSDQWAMTLGSGLALCLDYAIQKFGL